MPRSSLTPPVKQKKYTYGVHTIISATLALFYAAWVFADLGAFGFLGAAAKAFVLSSLLPPLTAIYGFMTILTILLGAYLVKRGEFPERGRNAFIGFAILITISIGLLCISFGTLGFDAVANLLVEAYLALLFGIETFSPYNDKPEKTVMTAPKISRRHSEGSLFEVKSAVTKPDQNMQALRKMENTQVGALFLDSRAELEDMTGSLSSPPNAAHIRKP